MEISQPQRCFGGRPRFPPATRSGGPAIIGYGRTAGQPRKQGDEHWRVPIHFEVLVDPTRQILASKAELAGMDGAASMWRTKSSGILIKAGIAEALERAVIGRLAQPISDDSGANPDWTRDELILALSFYLKHRPNPPGKESLELIKLSETLNHLGEKLFSAAERSRT
jgi:hypothetical protein